jgi:hypothetical protein
MKIWLYVFLIVEVDRGEWSVLHPGCFTPEELVPGTDLIGGWVGPTFGLHTLKMKKQCH